jgi:glycosyltransferase involved in cell wall biosynthesis
VSQAKIVKAPSKIIHSGTLHPWENVELFIKSMPLVMQRFPSAKFYLTRKGAKVKKNNDSRRNFKSKSRVFLVY